MPFEPDPQWLKDKLETDSLLAEPSKQWPINSLTGRQEHPHINWLISQLMAIKQASCSNEQLYDQSVHIHLTWSTLKLQGRRYSLQWDRRRLTKKSFSYKTQDKAGRNPNLGIAKQIDRLERAAKAKSATRWSTAWAATNYELRSSILRRLDPVPQNWPQGSTNEGQNVLIGMGDKSFSMLVPKADAVLQAILGEKNDLLKLKPEERSRRRKNPAEATAMDELRTVYRLVSGKEPTLTTYIGAKSRIHFVCFARAVSKRYGFHLIDDHGSRLRTRERPKQTPKPSRTKISRPA